MKILHRKRITKVIRGNSSNRDWVAEAMKIAKATNAVMSEYNAASSSGLPVYNALTFGATGLGIVDDTAALIKGGNAVVAAGGGILYAPAGTYICNNAVINAIYNGTLIVQGAGKDTTTFKATTPGTNSVMNLQGNAYAFDCTFDAGGVAIDGILISTPNGQTADHCGLMRVRAQNVSATVGEWTWVIWGQSTTSNNIKNAFILDVESKGPTNPAFDANAVSGVINCFADELQFDSLQRTPNFYQITNLTASNITVTNCQQAAGATNGGLVIDITVQHARIVNLISDQSCCTTINSPDCTLVGCRLDGGIIMGAGKNRQNLTLEGCDTAVIFISTSAIGSLTITGGSLGYGADPWQTNSDFCIEDLAPAATVHGPITITGTLLCNTHNGQIVESFNGTSGTLNVDNCRGFAKGRTLTDVTLNSTATIVSNSGKFTNADIGRSVSDTTSLGANLIPANTTIQSVTNATTAVMNHAATGNTTMDVVALGGYVLPALSVGNVNFTALAGSRISNTPPFNPVGQVHAPGTACPATGTAIAAVPYDSYIIINNGAAALTAAVTGGTTITYAVAANAISPSIFVPAGQTLTPTYAGGAPTYSQQGT